MNKAIISKLIPFSSVDGLGNRFAIFFQGCNFNCAYCHNPETIPKNDEAAFELSVEEIIAEIRNVKEFIRGITVSGGECTLQMPFLEELFSKVHSLGLTCFVDTNGSLLFSKHNNFVQLTDGFLLDVKSCDQEAHSKLTLASNVNVLRNLNYLSEIGKLAEVRTVIVEGASGARQTVLHVAKAIAGTKTVYKLIKYRPLGVRAEYLRLLKVPKIECMEELKQLALSEGVENVIII